MFDLKVINAVLDQFEEERGIPRAKLLEAIEAALASAWKKEYGKRAQVVRAHLDMAVGVPTFEAVKTVVDETTVRMTLDEGEKEERDGVKRNYDILELKNAKITKTRSGKKALAERPSTAR